MAKSFNIFVVVNSKQNAYLGQPLQMRLHRTLKVLSFPLPGRIHEHIFNSCPFVEYLWDQSESPLQENGLQSINLSFPP
jgi:hypothetical protein